MIDRIPAHMEDIEESILSACLIFPEMRKEILNLVTEQDFYKLLHQSIFGAIVELEKSREPVDLITVSAKLSGKIQGISSILGKISTCPVPTNIEYYTDRITNCRKLRDMQAVVSKAMNDCFDTTVEFPDVADFVNRQIVEIGGGGINQFITMRQLTERSAERYEKIRNGLEPDGVMTGFPTLDRLTGGLKGSKLVIIAARPGMGKTALACNMVANMAKRSIKSGVFSLEMDADELDDRWNSSETGINGSTLKSGGRIDKASWSRLIDVFEMKYHWPVIIDDGGGMNIVELKRRAQKMKQQGAEVIFIDQLSHIRPTKDMLRRTTFEINTAHVEELAFLKKELKIPIVLLAQLNRELEKRADKKPMLSDMKNTGALEEAADIVLLGYRLYPYTRKPEDEGHAEWEIAKQRSGPTWNIHMQWQPKFTRFVETTEREF